MKKYIAIITCTIATTLSAFAAPLGSTRGLPADSTALLHIDADALKKSALWKIISDEIQKKNTAEEANKINTITDAISGLTLGIKGHGDDILLVSGKFDKKTILDALKATSCTVEEVKIANHIAYKAKLKAEAKEKQISGLPSIKLNETLFFTFLSDNEILVWSSNPNDLEGKAFETALKNYDANISMPMPAAMKNLKGAPILALSVQNNSSEIFGDDVAGTFASIKETGTQLSVNSKTTFKTPEAAAAKKEEISTGINMFALIISMGGEDVPAEEKAARAALAKAMSEIKVSGKGNDLNVKLKLETADLVKIFDGVQSISKQMGATIKPQIPASGDEE